MNEQRSVSGILNVNKPQGITSHDVVARIRKLTGIWKVGHTGTLDPAAEGVLVVCLGQATRLIEYLMPSRKRYRAVIRFGVTTDTLDVEGNVLSQHDVSHLSEDNLQGLLPRFQGEIQQTPPIFSALKRGGRPLYKAARTGEVVEIEPRPVTIYALNWIDWSPPDLTLEISCASGTYIRALARDLGEAAGVGAHLLTLTRTANGKWLLDDAVSLDKLERAAQVSHLGWKSHLHPLDQAVSHLSKVMLDETAEAHVKHGRQVTVFPSQIEESADDTSTALDLLRGYTAAGDLLAILTLADANQNIWQPKKVFHTRD